MSYQSLPYQIGFYPYIALTVLLWIVTLAVGYGIGYTVKRYRR